MGETASNGKAPKTDFIKGLKAEFNKIIWPDKDTLTKDRCCSRINSNSGDCYRSP